jgi:hypothetical protein
MPENEAISALTLLVAVSEQALLELECLEPPVEGGAVEQIVRSRDQAAQLVRDIATRAPAWPPA